MRVVKLNITDEIFEKFMGLVDILPTESITIEEIDEIPFYPTISFKEAQKKVEESVADISKNMGTHADIVFDKILS